MPIRTLQRAVKHTLLRRAGHTGYLAHLRETEADQWRDPEQIRDLQWRRLQPLLAHAYSRTEHYRREFERLGLEPGDIGSFDDFSQLPILTKRTLRHDPESVIASGFDVATLKMGRSSGSTGKETVVYFDANRAQRSWAYNTRHNRWAGLDIGARVASVWGVRPERMTVDEAQGLSWYRRCVEYLAGDLPVLHLYPGDLSETNLHRFLQQIRDYRPHVLLGYGTALGELVRFAESTGEASIHIPAVISGAETLYPQDEERLKRVFGSTVYQRYGARETDIIASHCERGSLHLNDDNLIVEISAAGEVIVTDLFNYAMPLIRYALEDNATLSDRRCECGRGLRCLESFDGRTTDVLLRSDGSAVTGQWICSVFHHPGIEQFQVRQRTVERLEVALVLTGRAPEEAVFAAVRAGIADLFGNDTAVEFTAVDELKRERSGKFRFIRSDVWSARSR